MRLFSLTCCVLCQLLVVSALPARSTVGDADPVDAVDSSWLLDRGSWDLESALLILSSGQAIPDSGGRQLTLDGMTSDRWVVLVDGVRLIRTPSSALTSSAMLLRLFNPEQVRISHGPQPSVGTGALAGVVEIRSQSRRPAQLVTAGAEGWFGESPMGGAELRAGFSTARHSVDLDVVSGWQQPVDHDGDGVAEQLASSSNGVRGRLVSTLSSVATVDCSLWLFSLERQPTTREQRFGLVLGSSMEFMPQQRLRFQIVRQALAGEDRGDNWRHVNAAETAVEARYRGQFVAGHQLNVALSGLVEEAQVERYGSSLGAAYRVAGGVTAVDRWQVRENLQVLAQTSLNLDDAVGGLVGGRISLRYEPARAILLRGAVGTSHRAPSLEERTFQEPKNMGATALGSSRVRPEHSQGLRLSAGLEPRPEMLARLTLFRTDYLDLIQPSPSGGAAGGQQLIYRNVGQAHVQGLKLDFVALKLVAGLGLRVGHQWLMEALNDRTGEPLPFRPRYGTHIRVTWDIPSLATHLFVDTDLIGAQAYANGESIQPRAVLHAGVRQLLFGFLELRLAVDNAADALGHPALPLARRTVRAAILLH